MLWAACRSAQPQDELSLSERRAAAERAENLTSEPDGVEYRDTEGFEGLMVQPRDVVGDGAVLYLFGGGYVLGSPASRRKTAGHVALATGLRVFVPAYRIGPEHPFPAALDDALRAYRRMLGLGIRGDRSIVMGDSAGGGLASALLLTLRDAGDPLPAGCVALSPWVDLECLGDSMESRREVDVMFTRKGLLQMADWYLDGHDPRDPLVSPVHGRFEGLPPLLVLAGGDEILLDDAWRLARRYATSGADATVFIGAGMQHVWPIWVGALPEADAAMSRIGDWVRGRTGREKPDSP